VGFFIKEKSVENLSLKFTFLIALAISIPANTSQKAEDENPEKMISLLLKENIKLVNKNIREV
jgi:hypothetical protein